MVRTDVANGRAGRIGQHRFVETHPPTFNGGTCAFVKDA
jgi:hypothetical protein